MTARKTSIVAAVAALAGLSAFGAENSFNVANGGNWETPENWSLGQVPGPNDDVVINITAGKTVTATEPISVKSLTLTKGDLMVQAGPTEGVSVTDWWTSAALLWANRLTVSIDGKLTVSSGANLLSANDPETGTPVAFTCGSLEVAAGGRISADRLGYQWVEYTGGTAPADSFSDNSGNKLFYTFAPGHGQSYGNSGGYGGRGAGYSVNPPRGIPYGYEDAPFMSGSPVGTYNGALDYPAPGSVVVFVDGHAQIDGAISATETGTKRGHGSNSGGGIWLCAGTLDVSPSASITARGGTCAGSYQSPGAGGRVAIGLGLTESDIESLAAGTEALSIAGLKKVDAYGFECDALAGLGKNGTGTRGDNGTAVFIYRDSNVDVLSVSSDPANSGTATPGYGFHAYAKGTTPALVGPSPMGMDGWRDMRKLTTVTREDIVTEQPGVVWKFGGDKMLLRVKIIGNGTVACDGNTYTEDFEVWLDAYSTNSIATGNGLTAWYGDIPGGKSEDAILSFVMDAPALIYAVYGEPAGTTLTYTGAANGFWDDAANWTPSAVPGPLDNVEIPAGKTVRGVNTLAVKSLSVSGSLALGGTTANATTAQKLTDLNGGFAGLYVEEDMTVSGGCVTLGSRSQTAGVTSAFVGGDLALSGAAKLSAYAGVNHYPLSGTFAEIFADHFVFTVGGDFTLSDTAVAYPVADEMSGTPVEWKVGGNFSLGATAKIDCTNLGFSWTPVSDIRSRESASIGGVINCTLSPGLPVKNPSYDFGANYGGETASAVSSKYAPAYGNKYAPFMPGSACSCYNGQAVMGGGGTAWVNAKGEMNLAGQILADGPRPTFNYSGPSGGAIWLLAKKITAEPTAKLSAEGGKNYHSALWASGTGGRISLAVGMTDADIAAIVAGAAPETLTDITAIDDITLVAYSVRGGVESTKTAQGALQYGPSGTATTLTGASADTLVTVTASPVLVAGVTYGAEQKPQGETATFTAPASGSVPGEETSVRYSLVGWVCSNATEQVAAGNGTTASFPVGKAPLTLTWLWGNRETRACAVANNADLGAIAINGETSSDGIVWVGTTTDITVTALPEAGCEFLYWVGDFPFGKAEENPLTLSGGAVRNLTAIFRVSEGATTRTWVGSGDAAGDFLDASKWSPAGIPGKADILIIGNGTIFATNAVVCGALEVGGSAIVRLAATTAAADNRKDIDDSPYTRNAGGWFNSSENTTKPLAAPSVEEALLHVSGDFVMSGKAQMTIGAKEQAYRSSLIVGGDLSLTETNKLMVVAGPIDETFTFASGAGFVTVGGKLLVSGASKLRLASEGFTGGSVVIRANRVEVGEEATIDATHAGWNFYYDRIPNTLAPGYGYDYTIGAGYGGYGMRSNVQSPSQWETYGLPYGQEYAPIHPGSCKGSYGGITRLGGGLIRIHAQSAKIDGTLDANASIPGTDIASSASGGGIWFTCAGPIRVGRNAKFLARGGYRCYSTSYSGGGGRIALWEGISDSDAEELAATGLLSNREMPGAEESAAAFAARYPGASFDVSCGETAYEASGDRAYDPKYDGTFRYFPIKPAMIFFLR